MPIEIPAVRILPMSDKIAGFRGRSIEDVQTRTFLQRSGRNAEDFVTARPAWNAPPGTIVLFQFKAHIIASTIFLRDERHDKPIEKEYGGTMYFDVRSIRTFNPLNVGSHAPRVAELAPAPSDT